MIFCTALLDSLLVKVYSSACNSASSVAACLHQVSMPRNVRAIFLLDVALMCLRLTLRSLSLVVHAALNGHQFSVYSGTHMLSGFSTTGRTGATVNCLFLVGS